MDPSHPPPMVREFVENVSSSDRTDRTVEFEDVSFDLRYALRPGVDVRIQASGAGDPEAAALATIYDAAADRPPSYPPELPFLPGVKASVMDLPERAGASATWGMLPDLEAALAGVLAQSEAAGWTPAEGADEGQITPGVWMIALARPGQGRTIIVASLGADSMITVLDKPTASSGESHT
jgi:hypothetical protein